MREHLPLWIRARAVRHGLVLPALWRFGTAVVSEPSSLAEPSSTAVAASFASSAFSSSSPAACAPSWSIVMGAWNCRTNLRSALL